MLKILIQKELRAIISSPKFTATFAVCSILILLSIFTGVREYRAMNKRYDAANKLVEQELHDATSWGHLSTKVFRAPDPMQIFIAGLDYDIGRRADVTDESSTRLRHSVYSDDPIYAVFRFIDFSFIVQVVLSLFAILFTFNAINGEREDGTLKLVFSNSVTRAKYLIGKCIGSWLGLTIPILIPILLGFLIILLYKIPLSFDHWLKIFSFLVMSMMLFSFFIVLGVFISALTRHSAISFLLSLVIWLVFVMIIPRAGVMAASHFIHVPRLAEIESQIDGYSKQRWEEFVRDMEKTWDNEEFNPDNEGELSDEALWSRMERHDSLHKEVEADIMAYDRKVNEELRQRKIQQERLAFALSRFSPVSAYQLGMMSLAGTNIDMKTRYEDAINNYRRQFFEFVDHKKEETGDDGRMMIAFTIDEKGNQSMQIAGNDRSNDGLDVNEVPQFDPPRQTFKEAVAPVIFDFCLLGLYIFISFMGAFIAFIKYDLR